MIDITKFKDPSDVIFAHPKLDGKDRNIAQKMFDTNMKLIKEKIGKYTIMSQVEEDDAVRKLGSAIKAILQHSLSNKES